MTTDDKIKIIRNWTYQFNMDRYNDNPNNTPVYAMITYTSTSVMSAFTEDHPSREGVIDEAYTMVYNRIWNILQQI